jgi:quinol monooxygenase YgiN
MVVVAGTASLRPGEGESAEKLIEEVVRLTRPEAGCLSYTFYYAIGDPNTIRVFEEWESEEALNAHLGQDHTQRFLASIGELVSSAPDVKRYFVDRIAPL